jgi:hypothetical protein
MKKIIAMIMLMMTSIGAYADTNYDDGTKGENNPILSTKDFTGVWVTERFTYDKDMNMIFCQENSKYESYNKVCTKNGENGWRKMDNIAPPGKKVVGFKVTYVRGTPLIEIYWK